jgi:hypothetical protein
MYPRCSYLGEGKFFCPNADHLPCQ